MNTNYTLAILKAKSTAPRSPDPRQLRQHLKNWPSKTKKGGRR